MAKKSKDSQLAWHPDFRSVESLPDIKVIRTDFFVNILAVTLAVLLAGYWAYIESQLYTLNNNISRYENDIAEKQGGDKQAIQLSNKFEKVSGRLEQLRTFTERPMMLSDYLAHVASVAPESLTILRVVYDFKAARTKQGNVRDRFFIIEGTIRGTPEEAPAIVNDFLRRIGEESSLGKSVASDELQSLDRKEDLDEFDFRISITLNPYINKS